MPTKSVSYASLSTGAQALVAVAGRALQQTSYTFSAAGRGGHAAVTAALEQSIMQKCVPQRSIASVFAASAGTSCTSSNHVVSSVGQLRRDGWRCEQDVAQHCLRFSREAHCGPSGEIEGLRSWADFAHVLQQWHATEQAPSIVITVGQLLHESGQMVLTCTSVSGRNLLPGLRMPQDYAVRDLRSSLASHLGVQDFQVRLISPDGVLLEDPCEAPRKRKRRLAQAPEAIVSEQAHVEIGTEAAVLPMDVPAPKRSRFFSSRPSPSQLEVLLGASNAACGHSKDVACSSTAAVSADALSATDSVAAECKGGG